MLRESVETGVAGGPKEEEFVGPCSTVEPLAFFGLRCPGRDGHGEGDLKKGQQSNGNHQHSSSGDCLWGNLSKEGSW